MRLSDTETRREWVTSPNEINVPLSNSIASLWSSLAVFQQQPGQDLTFTQNDIWVCQAHDMLL